MHKEFDARVRELLPHRPDLIERKLARQNKLREADCLQERRFFGRPDVALGRRMELHVGELPGEKPHVLHDQHVSLSLLNLEREPARRLHLVFFE